MNTYLYLTDSRQQAGPRMREEDGTRMRLEGKRREVESKEEEREGEILW